MACVARHRHGHRHCDILRHWEICLCFFFSGMTTKPAFSEQETRKTDGPLHADTTTAFGERNDKAARRAQDLWAWHSSRTVPHRQQRDHATPAAAPFTAPIFVAPSRRFPGGIKSRTSWLIPALGPLSRNQVASRPVANTTRRGCDFGRQGTCKGTDLGGVENGWRVYTRARAHVCVCVCLCVKTGRWVMGCETKQTLLITDQVNYIILNTTQLGTASYDGCCR